MFLPEQAGLHRFEKYVPSSWEEKSVLEDEDACHQIESAEDEVVMWLHHTQARRAQLSVLTCCFCLMTMSACIWRALHELQHTALLYIRAAISLTSATHCRLKVTLLEPLTRPSSRVMSFEMSAQVRHFHCLFVTGAHMASTWLTCKLWDLWLQYLMRDTDNNTAKGQGQMTPLLCLLSLSSGI